MRHPVRSDLSLKGLQSIPDDALARVVQSRSVAPRRRVRVCGKMCNTPTNSRIPASFPLLSPGVTAALLHSPIGSADRPTDKTRDSGEYNVRLAMRILDVAGVATTELCWRRLELFNPFATGRSINDLWPLGHPSSPTTREDMIRLMNESQRMSSAQTLLQEIRATIARTMETASDLERTNARVIELENYYEGLWITDREDPKAQDFEVAGEDSIYIAFLELERAAAEVLRISSHVLARRF